MAKSSGTGWRQQSNGFLASIAAVSLIVVLLGGMGIGYAIEKGRVKTTKTTAAKRKATAKAKTGKLTRFRITGTVTIDSGGSITVTPKKGAKRKLAITKTTVVEKAGSGASGDIATNHKVIMSAAGSLTKANAVIVLPKTSRLGTLVAAADGSTMSLKTGAKVVKVTTTGASVDKTSPGKAADVHKGDKVIISGVKTASGVVIAVEIIVLPSNSPFA